MKLVVGTMTHMQAVELVAYKSRIPIYRTDINNIKQAPWIRGDYSWLANVSNYPYISDEGFSVVERFILWEKPDTDGLRWYNLFTDVRLTWWLLRFIRDKATSGYALAFAEKLAEVAGYKMGDDLTDLLVYKCDSFPTYVCEAIVRLPDVEFEKAQEDEV